MNKSTLKAEFINAKIKDAKYIGVSIKTEGSSQPEIIINPRENFDAKFDYYMEAYDDDLILIAAKGKKDIRNRCIQHNNSQEQCKGRRCTRVQQEPCRNLQGDCIRIESPCGSRNRKVNPCGDEKR